ncbi:MAG: CocE/NonD family hydrolase [Planctomycetota bacterium]
MYTRYNRAVRQNGQVFDSMRMPVPRELVRRGYAVAAVDVRGSGASFGRYEGPFHPQEMRDATEIMAWFVAQPWCDGNLGMYGGSYLGAVQLFAAATGSPHLKAIVPEMAPGDLYAFTWVGGIYRDDFLAHWTALTKMLDTQRAIAPVAADADGSLLEAAIAAHAANRDTVEQYSDLPFRDSVDEESQLALYPATSTLDHHATISRSGVAIYQIAGWLDCFTRDALLLHANLENPRRIAIGPWFHQERQEFDDLGEHLRWYDCWLKGIDNGIDEEPPVHYYVVGAPEGQRWRTAAAWPVPAKRERLYFLPGADIPAQGSLVPSAPAAGAIPYQVDYSTTCGTGNRWRNGYGGEKGYADLAQNDAKGISFTSSPQAEAREVIGHPLVTLWIASNATDGDFFVYLEEVEPDGFSRYVTEGALRASHRAVQEPPYDCLGLPWHRSHAGDAEPVAPGVPVALSLDLQPTAWYFDAGNRLRVTITGADAGNCATPILDPAPTVTLHTGAARASFVELPFAIER